MVWLDPFFVTGVCAVVSTTVSEAICTAVEAPVGGSWHTGRRSCRHRCCVVVSTAVCSMAFSTTANMPVGTAVGTAVSMAVGTAVGTAVSMNAGMAFECLSAQMLAVLLAVLLAWFS